MTDAMGLSATRPRRYQKSALLPPYPPCEAVPSRGALSARRPALHGHVASRTHPGDQEV